MRWKGDRGLQGAKIISRKVSTWSGSWRFEALFKVKLKCRDQECHLTSSRMEINILPADYIQVKFY